MKKWMLLLISLILLSVFALGCDSRVEGKSEPETLSIEEKLVGEWLGTDSSGQSVLFIFNKDKTVIIVAGNEVIDGIGKGEIIWEIDDSSNPVYLNMIARNFDDEGEWVVPNLFRFLTDDKIQLCTVNTENAVGFADADKENLLVLEKQ
jgi:hypothetical protein